jgi:hypothetical protein
MFGRVVIYSTILRTIYSISLPRYKLFLPNSPVVKTPVWRAIAAGT